jgi:hypothetical protein
VKGRQERQDKRKHTYVVPIMISKTTNSPRLMPNWGVRTCFLTYSVGETIILELAVSSSIPWVSMDSMATTLDATVSLASTVSTGEDADGVDMVRSWPEEVEQIPKIVKV